MPFLILVQVGPGRREESEWQGKGRIKMRCSLATAGGTQLQKARGVGPARLRGMRDTKCPQIHPSRVYWKMSRECAPKGHCTTGSPSTLVLGGYLTFCWWQSAGVTRWQHYSKHTSHWLLAAIRVTVPLWPARLRGRGCIEGCHAHKVRAPKEHHSPAYLACCQPQSARVIKVEK